MVGSAPPEAVERFRGDIARCVVAATHGASPTDQMEYALAVSGGPDSMAMLALAHAAFPGHVAAATFDHRLRPGSADEACMVAEACAARAISHVVLTPDRPIAGSSLQMRARDARYAALTAWAGARPLLTAHHADDQAETLLMRLNRSSGLAGLSAIRAARWENGTPILRPLLGWRRGELRASVETVGLPFVDDPSNADDRHDRTRMRKLLAATSGLDPAALAASAGYLAEAEEVVARAADLAWSTHWNGTVLVATGLPRELRRRLLRRAILALRALHNIILPAFTSSSNVEPLLDSLDRGQGAVQGGVKVTPGQREWTFAPAPPRRSH